MAYLSKEIILKSYLTLSSLTEDHKQGQTQIVSAIRHFFALDMFYKSEVKDCDLNNSEDRKLFVKNVQKLVNIKDSFYTTNFYTTLKPIEDCGVGSNFTSVGVVNNSKQNTSATYDYPTRGGYPLFNVRNVVAIRNTNYYKNITHYLFSDTMRAAFIIWMLRNEFFTELNTTSIKKKLLTLLTTELVNAFAPKDEIINSFIDGFALTDHKYQTEVSDIMSLFQNDSNNVSLKGNYSNFLTAIRTKPFILLAGISGTGKSRIVRKLAQASVTKKLQSLYDPKSVESEYNCWKLHKPANFEIIQIKPNWHNSMDVVGYLSNIPSKHYEFTPFTEFIGRAWLHQDIPFFLCLDEMNLAPVEEYFAEFLSAIESRSKEEGKYVTDPIIQPFNNFNTKDSNGNITENLSDIMIAKLIGALDNDYKSNLAEMFRTKGLTLPPNLIVMGTVNMDETTYSFSRKVLDRAMSIEMNEVNFDSFITGESENDIEEFDEKTKKYLVDRPISATKENVTDKVDSTRIIDYLKCINILFDNTPFKLGYRAANEAILYASAAKDFGNDSLASALDEFTLMKILSRIEGDESKLSIDEIDPKIKALNYNSEDVKYKGEGSLDTTGITILSFLHRIIVDKLGKYYQEDQDLATQEEKIDQDIKIGMDNLFDNPEDADSSALVSPDAAQCKQRKKLKSLLKLESMMNQLSREHFVTYWN